MTYDPKVFWNTGEHMPNTTQHKREAEMMLALFATYVDLSVASVLEVGSGAGRIWQVLNGGGAFRAPNYCACDIAVTPRRMHRKNTGIFPDEWDGKVLPYEDGSFDLVILFDVILHVPPKDLETFWLEMLRVCRGHLFVATGIGAGTGSTYCFNHNYDKLSGILVYTWKEKGPGGGHDFIY